MLLTPTCIRSTIQRISNAAGIFLPRHDIGLVPVTNLQVDVICGIKVINLCVTPVIPAGRLESVQCLNDERLRRAGVMLMIPILVDIEMVILGGNISVANLWHDGVGDAMCRETCHHVTDEINLAATQGERDGVLGRTQGTLHPVLGKNGLDLLGNDSLASLVHIRHVTGSPRRWCSVR
jgi:hypothetical protein